MFGIENYSEAIVKYGSEFEFSQLGQAALFGGAMVLIGMATIFSVLCLLWGCLSLFKLVFHDLPAKKAAKAVVVDETPVAVVENTTSDDEIIAVIAAAIAMAESEDSGSKFRVVSFKRK